VPGAAKQFELFHNLTDRGSAQVRKLVVDRALEAQVRFRKRCAYPEVRADLHRHGGSETPALWDGEHLLSGEAAVTARLLSLVRPKG
jgi:hypothetical protein